MDRCDYCLTYFQDFIGGLHIWFMNAPLFPLESHVYFWNVSGPKHYVWCGQEWGLRVVGSQDFELCDSARRPGRIMPLCKWAFLSSWFSTWISCKCKLELRREGEYGFQCLHSSAVWDVFFKRKGQTSNDLRFTLERQSSTINWHLLHTQTFYDAKPLWKPLECRLSYLFSHCYHFRSCLERAQQ